jgi:peptidoglycan hydrolase-like protein with peptidoglycan-binding domain
VARPRPSHRPLVRFHRTPVLLALALLAAACGSDDKPSGANTSQQAVTTEAGDPVVVAQARVTSAESSVTTAGDALTAANASFCSATSDYVEAIDRYGKLFNTQAATVGDVKTVGADLAAPRDSVSAAIGDVGDARTALADANQELIDAQGALAEAIATASSTPTGSTAAPGTTTTTTLVPPATLERVEQAEKDLASAGQGITDATPLNEAAAEYNSAAFALEVSWLKLMSDAGCLSNEQQEQAVELVTGYTTALQTELVAAGYEPGEIDGIYGPATLAAVKQLQKDSGLPETGFVDIATGQALDDKVAAAGQEAAVSELTHTAAVQTVLSLTGFWTGAIDGIWTDELTVALQAFQSKLGVAPTGEVDPATLAAFQLALTALKESTTTTTTVAPSPTTPSATTPTSPSTATTTPATTQQPPPPPTATG